MSDEETTKEAESEIVRLKDLENQNNNIKQQLQIAMQKNQNYEQTFNRISGLLGELLAHNARTTYLATMINDIIASRNTSNPL